MRALHFAQIMVASKRKTKKENINFFPTNSPQGACRRVIKTASAAKSGPENEY